MNKQQLDEYYDRVYKNLVIRANRGDKWAQIILKKEFGEDGDGLLPDIGKEPR